MKKHLIAAAVAAAVAVPAMAQVTMSGRIDTSVGSAKNTTNVKSARVQSNVLSTNQIVFSGSEDLGGGLKANFNISSSFATDTNAALSLGDRGVQVGVSGGFGALDIGKSTGTMMSSTSASGLTGNIGNLAPIQVRPANSISFTTPALSGFTGRIVYGVGDEVTARSTENKSTELSVQYVAGPLLVRAAQNTIENFVSTAVAATTISNFGTAATAIASFPQTKVTETAAQVDYNFGVARVNLRLQNRAFAVPSTTVLGANDFNSYGFGAAVPFGATTLSADFATTDSKLADGTADVKVTSLTAVNALSKRTNVYGAYASRSTEVSGSIAESLFAVGVRHSF